MCVPDLIYPYLYFQSRYSIEPRLEPMFCTRLSFLSGLHNSHSKSVSALERFASVVKTSVILSTRFVGRCVREC